MQIVGIYKAQESLQLKSADPSMRFVTQYIVFPKLLGFANASPCDSPTNELLSLQVFGCTPCQTPILLGIDGSLQAVVHHHPRDCNLPGSGMTCQSFGGLFLRRDEYQVQTSASSTKSGSRDQSQLVKSRLCHNDPHLFLAVCNKNNGAVPLLPPKI